MKLVAILFVIVVLAYQLFEASAWVSQSFVTNGGYVGSKFWIQWGTKTSTSDNSQSFSFATPFPSACVYVGINIKTANQAYQLSSNSWDTDGFTINRDDAIDGDHDFSYIALGYNSSAPDNLGDLYGNYVLGSTAGYARLNSMEWQWGRNDSTSDNVQSFALTDPTIMVLDWGHAGLNLKESGVQTQLSFAYYSTGYPVEDVERFYIDRDNQMDGTNTFQWHAFSVNPARNATTPDWDYQFWNETAIVANMTGLWVQTQWLISSDNGSQYFRFVEPFPNACYHVGINMWVQSYKVQLSATGWNTTHFWINRSNDFTPSNVWVEFSMLAIGH